MEKSLCLFSSYLSDNRLPKYIEFYLEELKRHFSEVTFICNEDAGLCAASKKWLKEKGIQCSELKNDGYDFGMWYRTLKQTDTDAYGRIALVNDSCVLFNKLDALMKKVKESPYDYCGLLDSNQGAWHVQSYFLVLNSKAVKAFMEFSEERGLVNDYRRVIDTYEIPLPAYLASKGISAGAIFSYKDDARQPPVNPAFVYAKELVGAGMPMIKKKIMNRSMPLRQLKDFIASGFDPSVARYCRVIKKAGGDTSLFDEWMGLPARVVYGLKVMVARIYLLFR